jgi:hypothetical protein
MSQASWTLDPDDPRAPAREVWERMTTEERDRVVAALPSDMPLDLHPPEGDEHRKPKERARDALHKLNGMLADLVEARDGAVKRAETLAEEVASLRAELEALRRKL